MSVQINDYNTYTVNGKVVTDLRIMLLCNDFNYATFLYSEPLNLNTTVEIKYMNITPVFVGVVTQCRKLARSIDPKTQYEIELVEPAIELKYKYITLGDYSSIYLKNDKKGSAPLSWYVANIIKDTDWTDASDAYYKTTSTPPGSPLGIPSMGFSVASVYTALHRLICTVFNYGLWFEYGYGSKQIVYGERRKTVTVPKPVSVTKLQANENYEVDGIIVYGNDNEMHATYGNIGGKRVIAYRYSGCNDESELKAVAYRIWEARKEPMIRYEIIFPPDYFDIKEGYVIKIGDPLVGLPVDEYGVKDVEIRNEYIRVGIGSPKTTIFDILNDRLSIIDGNVVSYNEETFRTNAITVECSTDIEQFGPTSEAIVDITGHTILGDFYITPFVQGELPSGSNFYRIFATTVTSAKAWEITYGPLEVIGNNVFDEDWFPWTWDYIEMEVQYIFDPDNTSENAKTKVEFKWVVPGGKDFTTENGGISDYQSTIYSSDRYSMVTHKCFVNSSTNTKYSYPYIKISKLQGDRIVLKDVLVRLAIFYKPEDEYVPVETTMEEGIVEMQFRYLTRHKKYSNITSEHETRWFIIYDTKNPQQYEDLKIDVQEYIPEDISSLDIKRFLIVCRAKGKGTCSVVCDGTYKVFTELTKVIKYGGKK